MTYATLLLHASVLLYIIVHLIIWGASSTHFNVFAVGFILYWFILDFRVRHGAFNERHIPIIPHVPFLGPLPFIDLKHAHTSITRWGKKLGPVFRISTAGDRVVFASDYQSIRDVCITHAKAAGGRPMPFMTKFMLEGTGILFSHKNDQTWKSLRMASQKHLKQFGDGLSNLEYVIKDVAEEMFSQFDEMAKSKVEFDPKKTIFNAALNTIAFLITGERNKAGDEIVEKMRTYEQTVLRFIGAASDPEFVEFDAFPIIRHLRPPSWKTVENTRKLQTSIWNDVEKMNKENPDNKSLYKVLMADMKQGVKMNSGPDTKFTTSDVQMTVLSLLLAGVTTTSTTFYSIINILAHKRDVQKRLYEEIVKAKKTSEEILLLDRQEMPYVRALLFELLRYASVVPLGVPHRSIEEVMIGGVKIPKDITISTNLWALHHDPDFWPDPYSFIPERFLDDNGDLVPADHPNRKHLMPFGAGARVCLGEAMALARLFIWIATFSQRFEVFPAEDNAIENIDARNYEFDGVVRVCPYNVKMVPRDAYKN